MLRSLNRHCWRELMKKENCFKLGFVRLKSLKTTKKANVTVLGAGGGVGMSLALLLKQSPLIGNLKLYDVYDVRGMTEDLSHINSNVVTSAYSGEREIADSLEGSHIVVITAGLARKQGMSRDDLFTTNAAIIRDYVAACAFYSSTAAIGIVTNPVNSLIPVACNTLKKVNKLDKRKVFGVTTLDVIRTATFLADLKKIDPMRVVVPVIGGHAGVTIVPVFSQAHPPVKLELFEAEILTEKIQHAGTQVLMKKSGAGAGTLAAAYAAARFTFSLTRALTGQKGIVECAYVPSDVSGLTYFSTPLELGVHGIEKNLGIGKLTDFEQQLLEKAKHDISIAISKAEQHGERTI